ncbi:MAG: hypothetical protein E6R07_04225 [Nevskiaceae bacterium]|nr:MAG: hypothetical protein E6R07_04225 [Nevskiaceae bacterium]
MTLQERERTLWALLMQTQAVAREAMAGNKAAAYRLRRRRNQLHRLYLALPDRSGENPTQMEALNLMMNHETVLIEHLHRRIVREREETLRSAS